jgi:hypothetical protein
MLKPDKQYAAKEDIAMLKSLLNPINPLHERKHLIFTEVRNRKHIEKPKGYLD